MSTNPRYNDYLKEIEAQSGGSAYNSYLTEIEASQPAPKPKLGKAPGKLRGFALSALRHIPFADEIGSAIAANWPASGEIERTPEGRVRLSSIGNAYKRNLAETEADRAAFDEAHPVASGLGQAAGFGASVLGTAPLGAVKGSALLGGLQGASEAEGIENRLLAGGIGAGIGGALGKGADWALKAGATRALATAGGVGGAVHGEGAIDSGKEAIVGASAGGLAGRLGGKAASGVLNKLRGIPAARAVENEGLGKFTQGLSREGKNLDDLLNFPGEAGDMAIDIGGKKGPIQRLGQTVSSYVGKGSKKLGDAVAARNVTPPASERAARKALGNRYTPPNPVAQEAKRAIRSESAPAYAELAGKEVSAEPLAALLRDEPMALELWTRAQELAKKRVKAGFDDAEELPDLFRVADDGSFEMLRETVPVRGLDMLKRALRSQVERTKNSPKPIDAEEAAILGKRLDDIVAAAKGESPEYADALKTFGQASEKQVKKLGHRKQLADAMLGNSDTQPRLQAQADFEGGAFDLNALNPREWLSRAMNSSAGRFMAGWNEKLADATANALMADVSTPAARKALVEKLRAQGVQEEEIRQVLLMLPRAVAGGVGIGAGSLLKEREP